MSSKTNSRIKKQINKLFTENSKPALKPDFLDDLKDEHVLTCTDFYEATTPILKKAFLKWRNLFGD